MELGQLYIVQDDAGVNASFGPTQAQWLLNGGFIRECTEHRGLFHPNHGLKLADLDKMVWANPDIRECDACRVIPADWMVKHRPFETTLGPAPGPFERPYVLCRECADLLEQNRKSELVDKVLHATVEYAKKQGGPLAEHVRRLTWSDIQRGVRPMVKEMVHGVFATRQGPPVPFEEPE